MPRCCGARCDQSSVPRRTEPESRVSRPAIIRNRVDFPQPEGPSRKKNSPSAISRVTPRSTGAALGAGVAGGVPRGLYDRVAAAARRARRPGPAEAWGNDLVMLSR